jgi:hypothetical protein
MPPSDHEAVAQEPRSFTGQYLKPVLARSPRTAVSLQPPKKGRRKMATLDENQADLIAAK